MKRKWGFALLFVALFFSAFFYIPGAVELFSGKMVDIFPHGLATAGIIISIIAMVLAWISYPRVHNFRITWLGFLLAFISVLWFILELIPDSKEFKIPHYILFFIIEFHLLLFLILPNSARRKKTFSITIIASLIQAVSLYLIYYYADLIPHLVESKWIKEVYFLILAYFIFFLLTFCITFFTRRGDFYLGGMISGLQLYTLIFLIRENIPYLPNFSAIDSLNSYFFFLSLFLTLGIIFHWISRIDHQINYDPLLKIYNRKYCLQILEEKTTLKTSTPIAVAMADIDFFKKVNDNYGHKAGDDVLYAVAQKIRETILPKGIVCRYGGEEFVLFFPGLNRKEAARKMEKVRKNIKAMSVRVKSHKIKVTISSGVSDRPNYQIKLEEVLNIADKALYAAKNGGRNCVKVATVSVIKNKKIIKNSGLLKRLESENR